MRKILVFGACATLIVALFFLVRAWIEASDKYPQYYLGSTKPVRKSESHSMSSQFPDSLRIQIVRHWITAPDGVQLAALSARSDSVPSVADIVLIHGYQSRKEDMLGSVRWLVHRGFTVWIPDLRSHGESEGANTTFGVMEHKDITSLLDTIEASSGSRPLALWGNSMGGATAIMTAATDARVSACISESAFSSRHDLLLNFIESEFPQDSWLKRQLGSYTVIQAAGTSIFDVDPIDLVSTMNCPTVLMHGTSDARVPFTEFQDLRKASSGNVRSVVIEGGTHHNLRATNAARYDSAIKMILDPVLASAKQ